MAGRLYSKRRWLRLRKQHLSKSPLCVFCEREGRTVPATVVDHIVPHKGDERLFFNANNLQSLCKAHHDSTKAAEEGRGYSLELDETGWPVDPRHPANQEETLRHGKKRTGG